MVKIRTREELRAYARNLGMVNAATADVEVSGRGDAARHRVGADAMRELGLTEEQILAKYGYLPEPLSKRQARPHRASAAG